jgi:hypothetical protein
VEAPALAPLLAPVSALPLAALTLAPHRAQAPALAPRLVLALFSVPVLRALLPLSLALLALLAPASLPPLLLVQIPLATAHVRSADLAKAQIQPLSRYIPNSKSKNKKRIFQLKENKTKKTDHSPVCDVREAETQDLPKATSPLPILLYIFYLLSSA